MIWQDVLSCQIFDKTQMIKYLKYLPPLSAWIVYLVYGVYVYFTSDGTLIDTLAGLL